MNTLTEEERIGLEDVFLSISTSTSKINRSIKIAKTPLKLLFKAVRNIKIPKFGHFMLKIVKKKKNLS